MHGSALVQTALSIFSNIEAFIEDWTKRNCLNSQTHLTRNRFYALTCLFCTSPQLAVDSVADFGPPLFAPNGTSLEELLRALDGEVTRQTLQRRLSALVRIGRIISQGAGPSTIYLLPKAAEEEENYVRLAPSGLEVRQLVRRPQSERTPVGYNRAFLSKYRPNESRYLTPDSIAYLTRIGATPDLERPAGTFARHK